MPVVAMLAQTEHDEMYQDVYDSADAAFAIGRFDVTDSILVPHLQQFAGDLYVKGCRLLCLSALYQDDMERAESYASLLLDADPFYTVYRDTPRFADLIETLKRGKGMTITTASRRAESMEESPVAVTVITEEMIRVSGAETLRDLLCLYVPTMTRVEGMESNICFRGVVGNSQEDILIMVDGHRLNSGTTNAESPDFRNSLHKIKQIEVLRGPASSLYGNVALMAVVNIITKRGADVGGAEMNVRAGSYSTVGVSGLYGNGNMQTDVLAWGSLYSSDGEKITYDGTPHYINGFNSRPAYDLGVKARWSDFSATFMHQHSKPVPFFNQLTLAPYSYDDYMPVNGNAPGASRATTNLFVDYSHTWGQLDFAASAHCSFEDINNYNVLGDSLNADIRQQWYGTDSEGSHNWMLTSLGSRSFGANANVSLPYSFASQRGSVLVGLQYDNYALNSSNMQMGCRSLSDNDGTYTDIVSRSQNDVVARHTESTLSSYLQLKHFLLPTLIFNGGLRLDGKIRFDDKRITTLSPRLAFIYMPTPVSNIKVSYAHSFVDAPYVYRATEMVMYSGGTDLMPQTNDALQLSGSVLLPRHNLRTELNLYYNRVRDLVYFSYFAMMRGDNSPYSSADVDICGAEAVVEYTLPNTYVNANMCYKYPIKMRDYSNYEHKIGNEPAFMFNVVAGQRLFENYRVGALWLRANVHFQTTAEMELNNIAAQLAGQETALNDHTPAQAMFNAGVDWNYRFLGFSVDAYNLFNSNYRVGAQLQSWIPAQSRKLMATIKIKI